jgi:signal transduction histidine kinase
VNSFAEDIALINSISAVPTILDVVCRVTGMGFAAVARVTEERWIACSVLDHINFGLKPGGELKVETTICHEIRQSRQAVIIDHVAQDKTYCNHPTPRQYGFQSYISMPIFLADGRFFGTLCCIDPKPARVNTPEITGTFKLFAELIAFHFDALAKVARSESALLAEREVAELREMFIGVLGHDLRAPLGALSFYAELLKDGQLGRDEIKSMEASILRMSELIEDTMDFTRGRLGGGITLGDVTDTPLEPVLKQIIDETQLPWPDRRIGAHFALNESFRYDRNRIVQLFSNLLSNAMAHGKPGTPVIVNAVSGGGKFELSVANAADPISPEMLQQLFQPFLRGKSNTNRKGLGLGLYIASQIAKSHGGTLEASSTERETRFTFRIPFS